MALTQSTSRVRGPRVRDVQSVSLTSVFTLSQYPRPQSLDLARRPLPSPIRTQTFPQAISESEWPRPLPSPRLKGLERQSSRVQGPRLHRSQSTSSSSLLSVDQNSLQDSPASYDTASPSNFTPSDATSNDSASTFSSTQSDDSYFSLYSKVSLQRRPHISRRQRHKQRTLPPYPQPLASRRRASLAQQKSHPITKTKVRGLPVPPLSMDNFPTISPECATPAPSIAQRESYYPSMEAWIDWKTLMEEILDGTMPPPWNS